MQNWKGEIPVGTFFPKGAIPVKVCAHRLGADATWSQDTDTVREDTRYAVELHAFKHNFTVTAFDTKFQMHPDEVNDRRGAEHTGRMKWDVYHQTDRWRDSSVPDSETDQDIKYPIIPSFENKITEDTPPGDNPNGYAVDTPVWGQDAVDLGWKDVDPEDSVLKTVYVGMQKTDRYPKHGQELYNVSEGDFGYDYVTDTIGASNLTELFDLIDYEIKWIEGFAGRTPTSCAFRKGLQHAGAIMLQKFIACRDSGYSESGDSRTAYGQDADGNYLGLPDGFNFTHDVAKALPSSTRAHDSYATFGGLTRQQALDYAAGELGKAITHNGWYNDFTHWHTTNDDKAQGDDRVWWEDYLSSQRTAIGTNFVWTSRYGEAMEYKFMRDCVNRVVAFEESGKIHIVVNFKDPYGTISLDRFTTPLSFEINLTGTGLSGSDITGELNVAGIRDLGADKYIVDINYGNAREGLVSARIGTTAAPNYYDLTTPNFTSITENGGVISVDTDQSVKLALFWVQRGGNPWESTILTRSNSLSSSHSIDLNIESIRNYNLSFDLNEVLSGDIYIGAINSIDQSNLSAVQRFIL